jgi:GNAT superfamily N-acetyltransferase
MLTIRPAVAADVPLLHTLLHEFAEFYKLPIFITEDQLSHDGFGAPAKFHVLIAEWAGQPAGYALFFDYYSSFHGPCIFLEDLFIRAEFRSQGVGKALLGRVAAIAHRDAPFGLILQVFDWNCPAVEFYKKLGAIFFDDLKTVCFKDEALKALQKDGE